MLVALTQLFVRDLARVKEELLAYEDQADLWRVPEGINNSAGNLALHLAGNLRHFVGHILGGKDFQRDREAEFGSRDVPLGTLIKQLDTASSTVQDVLPLLTEERLNQDFPHKLGPEQSTYPTRNFLLHLYGHLTYHLGQINYHRRLS